MSNLPVLQQNTLAGFGEGAQLLYLDLMDKFHMTVLAFAKPNEPTTGQCPACGGENGQHKHLSISYPYPMQLCMFKSVPCPISTGEFSE